MTEYVTPAQIGDGKCVRCGATRSQRIRVSLAGMDKPPFEIRCVNIEWCGRRRDGKR